MKRLIRRLSLLVVAMLCLTGCTEAGVLPTPYKAVETYEVAGSSVLAANSAYSLLWNGDYQCVMLVNNQTRHVWSTVPYSYFVKEDAEKEGRQDMLLNSPLYVQYFDDKRNVRTAYAGSSVRENNTLVAEIIDNGIRLKYTFENLEIMIPVEFTLVEKGLQVRVVTKDIQEGSTPLYSISLLPWLVSTQASADKDHYLFYPSGSGALMYADQGQRPSRTVACEMYGEDPSVTVSGSKQTAEECRIPMFGAKEGNEALCAILGEGRECATLEATAGDDSVGYAAVYPTFRVRGSDFISIASGSSYYYDVVSLFTDGYTAAESFSVTYCPLTGENADYVGMANCYRDMQLKDTDVTKESGSVLNLQVQGGKLVQDLVLGIPTTKLQAATTFAQAQEMLTTIQKATGVKALVQLEGFGSTGLDIGKIGGGFTFGKVFGNKKEYTALAQWCEKNAVALSIQNELARFSQGGGGVSTLAGAAQKPSSLTATYTWIDPVTRNGLAGSSGVRMLRRSLLSEVTDRYFAFADKNAIKAVGLGNLDSLAWSDYREAATYGKNGMAADVTAVIAKAKEQQLAVVAGQANDYAAAGADYVLGVPTMSAKADGMDVDVPVYAMLFKGVSHQAVEAVNLAADPNEQLLKAAESGIGLTFSLSHSWDNAYSDWRNNGLALTVFDGQEERLVAMTKQLQPLWEKVHDQPVVSHSRQGDVAVTVFANGTTVAVNYGDTAVSTTVGDVPAGDFRYC